ncbi:uncharacterized protein LOC135138136 [Zophobas morio]|uniref:uncharacterized protein LOC135138136 n=1 Tax=Zophobas morio TaxID=2755281 RepID=UPI003082E3FC
MTVGTFLCNIVTMWLIMKTTSVASVKTKKTISCENFNSELTAGENWILENSKHVPVGSVIDDRWTGFEIFHTSYQRFENITSASVSINCAVVLDVEFFADDGESLDYYKVRCFNHTGTWQNFSVVVIHERIYYTHNNQLMRTKADLTPIQIVIKTSQTTEWKIQNYEVLWANNNTNNLWPLKIPEQEEWNSLAVYSFLCKECILHVFYGNKSINITGANNETFLWSQSWKQNEITLNNSKSAKINFMISVNNSLTNLMNDNKFWGLDIHLCKIKNDYKQQINGPAQRVSPIYTIQVCIGILVLSVF